MVQVRVRASRRTTAHRFADYLGLRQEILRLYRFYPSREHDEFGRRRGQSAVLGGGRRNAEQARSARDRHRRRPERVRASCTGRDNGPWEDAFHQER